MDAVRVDVPDNLLEDEKPNLPTRGFIWKMKNPSKVLRMHLLINVDNGMPLATLFAQFALFTAMLFVRETGFYTEYDSRGIKTALSFHIFALLVSNLWRLSQFGFIHGRSGFKVNTIRDGICLIFAILLEKFYEKSLSTLGFALNIAVLFLILLVIIRPSTDLGFFSFLIGVIGSVAYNLFGLKFKTWIVVAICILLLGFKSWLGKNWLEVENQSLPIYRRANRFSKSKVIEGVTVGAFYLVWEYNLFRTNLQNLNVPDSDSKSCTSICLMAIVACMVIYHLWFALILVPRLCYLFRIVRASLLIKLIVRKDKWCNKFLLKGNDSLYDRVDLALKLALEYAEDGVDLLTADNIMQFSSELMGKTSKDLLSPEKMKINKSIQLRLARMLQIVRARENNDLARVTKLIQFLRTQIGTLEPSPIKPSDNQLSLEDMDIIKVVGRGNVGVVQLVQHKLTGQFFAVKVIQNIEQPAITRRRIEQELQINQLSQCPYVVVCYQSFYNNGVISIILEYMDGGSLADFLKKVKTIPEQYLAVIFKQVLKGLAYLHNEKHIIHRDLKPSSLLINHRGEVKITDFGVSAIMPSTAGLANSFVGTYNYMSPERILGPNYGNKIDIWGLGLVLLECATGQFPYCPPEEGGWTNIFELMEAIVEQPPPRAPSDQFSPEFCAFIAACLQKDPTDRWSAPKLMTHPFMNMYNDLDVDLSSYFIAGSLPATV